MTHHRWKSSHLARLIFLDQSSYLFRSQDFLRLFSLFFNFTFALLFPLTNLGLILNVILVSSRLTVHVDSCYRLHIQVVNIVLAFSFLRDAVNFNTRTHNAISFNRASLVLKCLFGRHLGIFRWRFLLKKAAREILSFLGSNLILLFLF